MCWCSHSSIPGVRIGFGVGNWDRWRLPALQMLELGLD